MLVRYICRVSKIMSILSIMIMQYMGLYIFSLPIFLVMIVRICALLIHGLMSNSRVIHGLMSKQ